MVDRLEFDPRFDRAFKDSVYKIKEYDFKKAEDRIKSDDKERLENINKLDKELLSKIDTDISQLKLSIDNYRS